jgi:hypothetical protein
VSRLGTAASDSAILVDVKQPFPQRPVHVHSRPCSQAVLHPPTSASHKRLDWGIRLEIRKQATPFCRHIQYGTVCHACAYNAPRFVLDPTNYRTILPPSSVFLLSKTPALTDLVKPHFCLVLPQAFFSVCPSVCLCPAFDFVFCICTSLCIVSSRPPTVIVSVRLHFNREPLL